MMMFRRLVANRYNKTKMKDRESQLSPGLGLFNHQGEKQRQKKSKGESQSARLKDLRRANASEFPTLEAEWVSPSEIRVLLVRD